MSQERHTYRSGVDDSYAGRSVCARVHCGSGEWLTGALSVSRLAHASRRGSRYLNRLVVSRVVSCVCPVLGLCGGPRAAACGAAGARWRAAGASARARNVRDARRTVHLPIPHLRGYRLVGWPRRGDESARERGRESVIQLSGFKYEITNKKYIPYEHLSMPFLWTVTLTRDRGHTHRQSGTAGVEYTSTSYDRIGSLLRVVIS